jgi:hypothetical protein
MAAIKNLQIVGGPVGIEVNNVDTFHAENIVFNDVEVPFKLSGVKSDS